MKKIILILLVISSGLSLYAQHKGRTQLSPKEFRAKQETFITQKAELSKKEAANFFPIFFELQDKKKEMNDKIWELIKKGKKEDVTESQYDELAEQVLDLRIEAGKLEKDYYKRFRKVLSAKKVYKVQAAEMRFHRELLKKHSDNEKKK